MNTGIYIHMIVNIGKLACVYNSVTINVVSGHDVVMLLPMCNLPEQCLISPPSLLILY